MATTKQQARLLARELCSLKPKEEGPERQLWQSMVFAIANNVMPTTICNEFEWACNHYGLWPNKG